MRRLVLILVAVPALALVGCVPPPPKAPPMTRTVVLSGLDRPWDVAFTPDGTMFFTERSGAVSSWNGSGAPAEMLDEPADLQPGSEGGMLGLAVDPAFSSNHFLYTCYTSNSPGGNGDVRVVRWTVDAGYTTLSSPTPIVTGMPRSTGRHSGCRPRFRPATEHLYITTGDAAIGTNPQNLQSLGGKVLRVTRDGDPVAGNPGIGVANFDDRIYTYGHRNVQGITFHPEHGRPYSAEHGTDCDDEINKLRQGTNYGWDPVPGYNESVPMTDFSKFPGARPASWSSGCPTIAPSGVEFLSGPQWGEWNGVLVTAVLKNHQLRFFTLSPNGMVATRIATRYNPLGVRLRSVVQGPDGSLYVTTDAAAPNGEIWRVTPG